MKFPSIQHLPWSPADSRDDKRASDNYWRYLKDKWLVITEKLDGGNTCLAHDGYVYARSHTGPAEGEDYDHLKAYIPQVHGYLQQNHLDIFGENMYAVHSIEYEELSSWFYVFAIRQWIPSQNNYTWLSWREVERISNRLGLAVVPTICPEKLFANEAEFKNFVLMGMKSSFGTEIEGYVIRRAGNILPSMWDKSVFKYVRKDHVQTDQHWSRNWKKAELRKK